MHVPVKGNEQITKLLNDWYQAMLMQRYVKASNLKGKIDNIINNLQHEKDTKLQDQNLLLYYSLLDFRYKVLTEGINISPSEFDKIENFNKPVDNYLAYCYHFYKAIHNTFLSNYAEAGEQFEEAESLLKYVPDELEQAEFNYRLATFYYQTYKPLPSITYINKAKTAFHNKEGYEINVALCENVLGLTCIQIRQFEQAEEHLNKAIDIVKKGDNIELLLRLRNNIGWLYASQGLSSLAIRHLSEVTEHLPNHYKAIFLQAKEHYKLREHTAANRLIEQGLRTSTQIGNQEYIHRFNILKELNNESELNTLESVIEAGISYFEVEGLTKCVQEYAEILATMFYKEANDKKASKYFYISNESRKQFEEKGALV
ncbi:tetratricopeptide repeat protein [Bacillus cereus]|nr:tetratricopeptide repeat protein [Bacillus cereus]